MSSTPVAEKQGSDEALLHMLAGTDAGAGMAVAERTRRAVRITKLDQRERQEQRRFGAGASVLAFAGLLVLLAPTVWSGLDDFMGGEHFSDLHIQVALLVVLLFTATIAALVASRRTREGDQEHR